MSKETSQWLNENTLIGFTTKRGNAWHYRASDQGNEPNHYPLAIPVADVQRRLFGWTAEERTLYVESGMGPMPIEGRKAIVRSDTGHVMGLFKEGYAPHQYGEWLVKHVSNILDDTLSISSAGLLKGGAVAWVEVSVPETITTPEGVEFRPNLTAATSFDGSLATVYKRTVQETVCDNTLSAALSEKGQQLKVKHTRYSKAKLSTARDALAIVHTIADDFAAEVQRLCSVKVTDHQWETMVDAYAPMPDPDAAKRTVTMAEAKRDTLWNLWNNDARVTPWSGSAFGALQAFNTYRHHEQDVRGMGRAERNMLNAVSGKTEQADADELEMIMSLV